MLNDFLSNVVSGMITNWKVTAAAAVTVPLAVTATMAVMAPKVDNKLSDASPRLEAQVQDWQQKVEAIKANLPDSARDKLSAMNIPEKAAQTLSEMPASDREAMATRLGERLATVESKLADLLSERAASRMSPEQLAALRAELPAELEKLKAEADAMRAEYREQAETKKQEALASMKTPEKPNVPRYYEIVLKSYKKKQ